MKDFPISNSTQEQFGWSTSWNVPQPMQKKMEVPLAQPFAENSQVMGDSQTGSWASLNFEDSQMALSWNAQVQQGQHGFAPRFNNKPRKSMDNIKEEVPHQSLYKTELCRSWMTYGTCRYGMKCQFAHGEHELRLLMRHPRYKTEPCKTYAATGFCPYKERCRFIHPEEKFSKVSGQPHPSSPSSAPIYWSNSWDVSESSPSINLSDAFQSEDEMYSSHISSVSQLVEDSENRPNSRLAFFQTISAN